MLAPLACLAHCAPQSGDGTASPNASGALSAQPPRNHGDFQAVHVASAARPLAGQAHAEAALAFSREHARLIGATSGTDFLVKSEETGMDGLRHVRLQQTHHGIKVWGADVVVHASATHVEGIGGTLAPSLPPIQTTPSMNADDAQRIALAHRFGAEPVATSRETRELVVCVDAKKAPHLAWHVTFFNEKQGGVEPGLWNYFVDAHTGDVLGRHDALHTENIALASGPSGTPNFAHTWTKELEVTQSGSTYQMDTSFQQTMNLNHSTFGGSVVSGSLDDIGDAPINDAHGYGRLTLKMLQEWQGFDSIDGKGYKLISRVHYDQNYENAFWDGQEMTYGDGDTMFYPLSGDIDVCAHEIDHGFTQFHAGLDASDVGDALNESFSDIAGMTATFYYEPDRADFNLGEDISRTKGKAIRYMCDPPADGRGSVDNVNNVTSGMDPHLAGGPQNKAFCRSAKRFASGDPAGKATQASVKRVSNAWYTANAHYWTSSTDYQAACQGVLDAARSLKFTTQEVDYLKTSWADVGANCN
jgi:Zn-dependent metalloprotease